MILLKLQIEDFDNSLTLYFLLLLFPKVEKLNISAIYKAIIIIFSVKLPMVFIVKIQIQPPGEPQVPQEHHPGEVRATQNFIKGIFVFLYHLELTYGSVILAKHRSIFG